MGTHLYLVATDLDGSLLDHDTYSYEPARATLDLLEQLRIPVVLASSKTRAEMLELREEMGNEHPFIVENGAAIFVPERYFLRQPEGTVCRDGFWVRELVPAREHWQPALSQLAAKMPESFCSFAEAGVEGISSMTGLSPEKAALANEREYSEPVQWRGDEEQLARFLHYLQQQGARVMRGGRFYSVGGQSDKGEAWQWLRQQYALASDASRVYDLTIGDGGNDVPMLEIADRALPIPAQGRPLPALQRSEDVITAQGFGPEAWAQGVQHWLRDLYQISNGE
ncbi:MAG: mannosyl-3-phosphoglycerate phosphatase-related protein [Congregibacter sp.]